MVRVQQAGPEVDRHVVDRAAAALSLHARLIDPIRKVARQLGYAIGEHGSRARDVDLIACPWTAEARAPELLVHAIVDLVRAVQGAAVVHAGPADEKPHGRRCWTITTGGGAYLDLSIMPRLDRL